MPYTLNQLRIVRAPAERVYRAFLQPAAIAKWQAPDGFVAIVHELDARVGGHYRFSFVNFSNGQQHSFGGRYLELVPDEKIVATDQFENPALPGEIITTTMLRRVACGTEISVEQAGLPDAIPPDACRLGWQQSFELLARLVEPEIPME